VKKRHGHYCWLCGCRRPNEAFSGKGRRRHLCRRCSRRPRNEREKIRAEINVYGFMEQKNISSKNIARLRSLCEFPEESVRHLAKVVLDVATVAPRRRKRQGFLYHNHPELYARLVDLGIYDEWIDVPEYSEEDEWADVSSDGDVPGLSEVAGTSLPTDRDTGDDDSIPF